MPAIRTPYNPDNPDNPVIPLVAPHHRQIHRQQERQERQKRQTFSAIHHNYHHYHTHQFQHNQHTPCDRQTFRQKIGNISGNISRLPSSPNFSGPAKTCQITGKPSGKISAKPASL